MKKTLLIFLGLVVGFVLFVGVVLLPPKQRTDIANREDGDRIVNALEAFHHARGSYPAELAQLAPQFIPAVPRQRSRSLLSPFGYTPDPKADAFVLNFAEAPLLWFPSDADYEYDSRTKEWKHHIY